MANIAFYKLQVYSIIIPCLFTPVLTPQGLASFCYRISDPLPSLPPSDALPSGNPHSVVCVCEFTMETRTEVPLNTKTRPATRPSNSPRSRTAWTCEDTRTPAFAGASFATAETGN